MMRFAGQALGNAGKFLWRNAGNGPIDKLFRIGPDVGFGVMAAAQTPGDLGDKLIAGGTQAAGGILGGIGTGAALNKIGMPVQVAAMGDMFGSYGGDFAGMAVGDQLQRGKDALMGGTGQTAWERMGMEQQAQMEQQLRQQILTEYGLAPQANPNLMVSYVDPSTGNGVA